MQYSQCANDITFFKNCVTIIQFNVRKFVSNPQAYEKQRKQNRSSKWPSR